MVDRDTEIVELYRQGLLYIQIAEIVGLSRSRVQAICDAAGVTKELPRKRGYRGKDDARARAIIGQRLREWLAESGKRQHDLVVDLGLHRGSVGVWVSGGRLLNGEAASAIERYFGKPEGSLYAETGAMPYRQVDGNGYAVAGRKCLCCEVLLSVEPESTEQAGLCVSCVQDIRDLQARGVLHCKDLLEAGLEWREMAEPDELEREWLDGCADDAILMARAEMMGEA